MKLGTFEILDKGIKFNELSFGKDIDMVLINFNLDTSIKIIPFFEKIRKKELDNLLGVFDNLGIDLRTTDLLGKLHVVILKILLDKEVKQVLVINDVGFTLSSIDFLQHNFSKLIARFENKSIFIYYGDSPNRLTSNFTISKNNR